MLKTGGEATKLPIGVFIIPYMFVFNPQILMINTTFVDVILISLFIGMFVVSAGLEGDLFKNATLLRGCYL